MQIKILDSGSQANCYILSTEKSQLIIDVGSKWENILLELDFNKKINCVVSHGTSDKSKKKLKHLDHSKSQFDVQRSGIQLYGTHNTSVGQILNLDEWKILICPAYHSIECISFDILNINENKRLFFLTDSVKMPNIVDKLYDAILVECNYSDDVINEHIKNNTLGHSSYNNHMNLSTLINFFELRKNKPKNLILCHTSNINSNHTEILDKLDKYADNLYIAKSNLKINI